MRGVFGKGMTLTTILGIIGTSFGLVAVGLTIYLSMVSVNGVKGIT